MELGCNNGAQVVSARMVPARKSHMTCAPLQSHMTTALLLKYQNTRRPKSRFETCFAIGSQHLNSRCWGSQPKHVSNPGSVINLKKLSSVHHISFIIDYCSIWQANVTTLSIPFNDITMIDPDAFARSPHISHLVLNDNQIADLSPTVFRLLTRYGIRMTYGSYPCL